MGVFKFYIIQFFKNNVVISDKHIWKSDKEISMSGASSYRDKEQGLEKGEKITFSLYMILYQLIFLKKLSVCIIHIENVLLTHLHI